MPKFDYDKYINLEMHFAANILKKRNGSQPLTVNKIKTVYKPGMLVAPAQTLASIDIRK